MITNQSSYARGGDYYNALSDQFGPDAANYVAQAAATGDEIALNYALSAARTSKRTGTPVALVDQTYYPNADRVTTLGNFVNQIATDPLAAPLDSLNNQLKNATKNVFGNPFVLLLVIAGIAALVIYAGGFSGVKRRVVGA